MSEQQQLLARVIDQAMDLGATDAEASMARSSSFGLKVFEQKIEQYNVSSSQVLGIRLIKDQRVGIAYCESLDDASVSAMVGDAFNNARWMDADEYEQIGSKNTVPSVMHNQKNFQADQATVQDKIDAAMKLERDMLARGPEVKSTPYCGLGESESEGLMMTSKGIECSSRSRSLNTYVQALLSNGKDNMTHYKTSMARTFGALRPQDCIEETYRFARDMLTAGKVESGQYAVIFTPEALSEFMGCFGNCLSGKSAREGQNPWREKVGELVASSGLTLRDLPHYKDAFSYSLFDSEGNPHRDLILIEQGRLKTFYHNSATARFFKVPNTHSASRSIKGRLGIGGTTMLIDAGRDSEASVRAGTYVEIHSMQGLHSGKDAISGDFSFGVKGYLWKNGVPTPFKDATIAGNYYKLLQQIEAFGDRLHADDSQSFFAPTIRWGGMSVSS